MVQKKAEKEKAIELRKQGLSYSEIIRKVSVSKASLSLWLQDIELSDDQKKRLGKKWELARARGAAKRHQQRLTITQAIHRAAAHDITTISKRELWLMGIMLYWAEGTKEKEWRPGSGVGFTNSDPQMIRLFFNHISPKGDRLE